MVRCNQCGSVPFWGQVGQVCSQKRCKGLLVKEDQDVEVSAVPENLPDDGSGDDSSLLPEEVAAPHGEAAGVWRDEEGLALRSKAVRLAKQVLEKEQQGEDASEDELTDILHHFVDLGSVYRPARGFPDMARARDQHKGQFFSHPLVGELIWALLKVPAGCRVLESCIGSANLIGDPSSCFVTGIDSDRDAVVVARALLGRGHLVIADELQHHQFREQFGLVVSNPPYSVRVRDRAKLWGWSVGWDGWGNAEQVWLEQAALAVEPGGFVAALLPVGFQEMLSDQFKERLTTKLSLVAEILLPRDEAHVFSTWPVSLYLWYAGPLSWSSTVIECHSIQDWLQKARADQNVVPGLAPLLNWPEQQHQGPVAVKAWRPVQEKQRTIEHLAAEEFVVVRVADGKLRLVPSGVQAAAKMKLLRLEWGNRYDRKLEEHLWHWDELVAQAPLRSIGPVMGLLKNAGLEVRVEAQAKTWLKRRARWYRRQMVRFPRWITKEE